MAQFELANDGVVVIIGSGAGGGTLAHELSRKGIDVVVLEAGKRYSLADFRNDDLYMFSILSWLDPMSQSGDIAKDRPTPLWTCKTVGGTTVHWAGNCPRFQPHEFKARTTYGDIPGASLIDWPLSYEEILPYYEKAEEKMGIAGRGGRPQLPGNNNFKVMAAGAKRVGYKRVHTGYMAINSVPYDDRPACQQIGFCMQSCVIGAKWSTLYTEIPKAEATGHCEVRPESTALKINHDDRGRVTGVVYADAAGARHEQKARAVAVAGNAVSTPMLLLQSDSAKYPKGLANATDQVGRYYTRHTTGSVFAVMPGPVHWNRGTQMAGLIEDEARHDTARGFAGGYHLETIPLGLAVAPAVMMPGYWGADYARDMEKYNQFAGMWICGEDLPQAANRITPDPKTKDKFGLPIPHVHYDDHENDKRMRNHAFRQGRALYQSLAAEKVYEAPPFAAGHNMSSCRMSARPEDGVCNKWGQTHEIANLFISDGSQFSTSGAPNPTLTIVALAIRQADYIADQMTKRAL
jgi:choline dehydrogenase-like flavoprotein